MSTIAKHLDRATAALKNTSDSPRLDAELLLAHILNQDRTELLKNGSDGLEANSAQQLKSLILQRAQHIPIPYLIGRQEFFGMSIEVTPDVLIPRPATELLVDAVLKHLPPDTTMTIADIGTGSGAISLALAKHLPQATIFASDVSPTALEVAKNNAERLGLEKRINFIQSSLLTSYNLQPELVIANLPYLQIDQLSEPSIQYEPRLALDGGPSGLVLVNQLIDQISEQENISGLVLELGPQQIQAVSNRIRMIWASSQINEITDGKYIRGIISWK